MWPYVSDYRGKHVAICIRLQRKTCGHMYQTTEVNMWPYVSDYRGKHVAILSDYRGKHVAICIRLQR